MIGARTPGARSRGLEALLAIDSPAARAALPAALRLAMRLRGCALDQALEALLRGLAEILPHRGVALYGMGGPRRDQLELIAATDRGDPQRDGARDGLAARALERERLQATSELVAAPLLASKPQGALVVDLPEGGASEVQHAALALVADELAWSWSQLGEQAELRRRNQELRAQAAQLQEMIEHAVLGVYQTTPDGRLLLANPALLRMLRYDSFAELVDDFEQRRTYAPSYEREAFEEVLRRDGRVLGWEAEWTRKDGSTAVLRENAVIVRGPDGAIHSYQGTVEDLSEQVAAEQARDGLQQRYQRVVDNIAEALMVDDIEGRVQYANKAWLTMFQLQPEDLPGLRWEVLVAPESREEVLDRHRRRIAGEPAATHFEHVAMRRDGSRLHVEVNAVPVLEDGKIVGTQSAIHDVTQRHLTQKALADSAARYALMFERNPMPMFVYDRSSLRLTEANEAALAFYGYEREEFLQLTLRDIRPPEGQGELDRSLASISGRLQVSGPHWHMRKNGDRIQVEVIGSSLADGAAHRGEQRLVLIRDMTHQLAAEQAAEERRARALELQREMAVSDLAGAVAHELSNTLTGVIGYAQLARLRAEQPVGLESALGEINRSAERAAMLSQQLGVLSRRQQTQRERVELPRLVASQEGPLARLLDRDTELRLELDPATPPLEGDTRQLQQLLLNLVDNARQAMPDGGAITISCGDASESGRPQARLVVEDQGTGIPPETLAQIFEPAYKSGSGAGCGLGLATARTIVEQHGGRIEADSELGAGARFTIVLPAVEAPASPSQAPAPPPDEPARGDETVLVVDDEEMVRELLGELLESAGYRVLVAGTASDALAIAAVAQSELALIIADVVLPEQTGPELVAELRTLLPELPVVYISGQLTGDVRAPRDGAPLLHKPIDPGALWATVRAQLDRGQAAP